MGLGAEVANYDLGPRASRHDAGSAETTVAYYNFCQAHGAIRMTPAMKADLTRKPWTMADLPKAVQAATVAA